MATSTTTRDKPAPARAPVPKGYGAIAGALGAGVALGVGELLSGFSKSIPSLVIAVGDVFVDKTPGDATETAIRTVGTNDKPLLILSIVLVSLVLGALIGSEARRHPRVAVAAFGVFGGVGGWAAARTPHSSTLWSWVSAALAATAGALVTLRLGQVIHARRRRAGAVAASPHPVITVSSRREFVVWSGGAAVAALTATGIGRALRHGRAIDPAKEVVAAGGASPSATVAAVAGVETLDSISGLSTYITPADDFYRIDTALEVPQVSVKNWKLKVGGLVDNPFEVNYDELRAMPQEEHVITLSCVSNEVGGHLVGNAVWSGVPLRALLERARVKPSGTQIVGRSVDDFTAGFPTKVALDGRNALLALTMNGEPLPVRHGFPARLIVPGLYGYVSAVKWIEEISLNTDAYNGYWIPRGWSKQGPMKTTSRIDVPRDSARVTAGSVAVAGVAWAPVRGIASVEVQVDDGPWVAARLGGAVDDDTWVQWVYAWDATPGKHTIRARATDKTGGVQSGKNVDPQPNGAEGYHTIQVTVK